MKISKDERFESLLADVQRVKHVKHVKHGRVTADELSESEVLKALEIYRKLILSERE